MNDLIRSLDRPSLHAKGTLRRAIGAAVFVAAGANHFRSHDFYQRMIPPSLPAPSALVAISGIAEIVGGLGLLSRTLRWPARWGLIALLLAVFPANVYMAQHPVQTTGGKLPPWMLWVRLPLQALMIWWVWWMTRRDPYACRDESQV